MDALLEPIIRSPMFPEYFEELQAAYLKECEKRRRFHEEITEDHKAEFINGEMITQSPAQMRHILSADHYDPSPPRREGDIESEVIHGFQIPIRAIFDSSENLRVISTILT